MTSPSEGAHDVRWLDRTAFMRTSHSAAYSDMLAGKPVLDTINYIKAARRADTGAVRRLAVQQRSAPAAPGYHTQNDWTLGAINARYCAVVTQHRGVEDAAVFPHLARREPQLKPVIEPLTEEHLVIHDAIQDVDRALVQDMDRPVRPMPQAASAVVHALAVP